MWLDDVREYCRGAGIKIVAWGPDVLTVEARSPDQATEIAAQLGHLGFKVIEDADDAYAGILSLSRNPAAIKAKIASFDISRRRLNEQIEPLIWALCSVVLLSHVNMGHGSHWLALPLGVLSLLMFFFDGSRIWGWRLELPPEGLRIRRYFRWSTVPWEDIRSVEVKDAVWGRGQENVLVNLAPPRRERLGTFDCTFARNLRDRLRVELSRRQHVAQV